MRLNRAILISTLALLAVGAFSACSRPTPTRDLAQRMSLPVLETEGWINGSGPDPKSLENRVVVLDVWAHW